MKRVGFREDASIDTRDSHDGQTVLHKIISYRGSNSEVGKMESVRGEIKVILREDEANDLENNCLISIADD